MLDLGLTKIKISMTVTRLIWIPPLMGRKHFPPQSPPLTGKRAVPLSSLASPPLTGRPLLPQRPLLHLNLRLPED